MSLDVVIAGTDDEEEKEGEDVEGAAEVAVEEEG
jgi:hypothetical protein